MNSHWITKFIIFSCTLLTWRPSQCLNHYCQLLTLICYRLLVSQREAALLKGEKSDLQEALNSVQTKL